MIDLIKTWRWNQWVIFTLFILIAAFVTSDRFLERQAFYAKYDAQSLEDTIDDYQQTMQTLRKMETLPPVRNQWKILDGFASQYGVKLAPPAREKGNIYSGPLPSWSSTIAGPTTTVLFLAEQFQKKVPTHLGEYAINGQEATIKFAVLGSD